MTTIAINKKSFDNFFRFLFHLDIASKKKLINKLTKSIENTKESKNNFNSLFGSWEDNRDSDLIIKDIIDARTNNKNIVEF